MKYGTLLALLLSALLSGSCAATHPKPQSKSDEAREYMSACQTLLASDSPKDRETALKMLFFQDLDTDFSQKMCQQGLRDSSDIVRKKAIALVRHKCRIGKLEWKDYEPEIVTFYLNGNADIKQETLNCIIAVNAPIPEDMLDCMIKDLQKSKTPDRIKGKILVAMAVYSRNGGKDALLSKDIHSWLPDPKDIEYSAGKTSIINWLQKISSPEKRKSNKSKTEDRIFINAKVNGKPLNLAFDTGANATIIFRHVAKRLDLKVTDPPRDTRLKLGQVLSGTSEVCSIDIFGSTITGRFSVVDCPSFLTDDMDGVLSWKSVKADMLRIDAENHMLSGLTNFPPDIEQWSKWNLNTNAGLLALQLPKTSQTDGTILIDTGSPFGVKLSPELWKEWCTGKPQQVPTLRAYITPASGIHVTPVYWADEWTTGKLSINDVPVMKASKESKHFFKNHLATLGFFALTKLDVIIDNRSNTIYMKKNTNPQSVYSHNRLGAVFVPENMKSKNLIAHVSLKTPAHKAGIRNGDILQRIGNLDVTKWRTDPKVLPLSRFWNQPSGTKLRLSIKRKSELLEITVVLKDILGKNDSAKNPDGQQKNTPDKK